ncbi:hypothetical protein LTR17_006366 [Elasticomyces elasticus]|nr:hypothetical protein LTR17_006366 [Elasticomyces elasticus]
MDSLSPFLELPAELRNLIYEFVALEDEPYRLKTRFKVKQARHIITTSSLILASHEIAEEYYSVLAKLSLTSHVKILARVTDFNFRHVIRFIKTEMSASQIADAASAKRLLVELVVSNIECVDPDTYSVWLKFCKRNGVRAGYTLDNAATDVSPYASGTTSYLWESLGREDHEARKLYLALGDLHDYRSNYRHHGHHCWHRVTSDVRFVPRF